MQKNPCYEDYTLPVYEEVQLQDKAAERSDTRVKQNERISSSFAKKTKTNISVPLVVVLSLLAIAMVAAIALSAYVLVSSNQGMDSLMEENKELMMQLNKTKMWYYKIEGRFHTNRNRRFDEKYGSVGKPTVFNKCSECNG